MTGEIYLVYGKRPPGDALFFVMQRRTAQKACVVRGERAALLRKGKKIASGGMRKRVAKIVI